MTIYVLLKGKGEHLSFHGVTTIQEASEAWEFADESNWKWVADSDDNEGDEEGTIHNISSAPLTSD